MQRTKRKRECGVCGAVCVVERVWCLFWREREKRRGCVRWRESVVSVLERERRWAVYASQRESQCSLFSNSAELESERLEDLS